MGLSRSPGTRGVGGCCSGAESLLSRNSFSMRRFLVDRSPSRIRLAAVTARRQEDLPIDGGVRGEMGRKADPEGGV